MTSEYKNYVVILGFILFLVLTISFISSKVALTGTIYDSNFEKGIPNEKFTAICDGTNLTGMALRDGSYYIIFNNSLCDNFDIIPQNESLKVLIVEQFLEENETYDEYVTYNITNNTKNQFSIFAGNLIKIIDSKKPKPHETGMVIFLIIIFLAFLIFLYKKN